MFVESGQPVNKQRAVCSHLAQAKIVVLGGGASVADEIERLHGVPRALLPVDLGGARDAARDGRGATIDQPPAAFDRYSRHC